MPPSAAPVRRCVLLFARAPRLEGRRKGLGAAAPVLDLAFRRAVAAARSLPGVDLVFAGVESSPATRGATVLRQRGRTFGERLEKAFADAFALGYDEILLVGGDVPGLDRRALTNAFEALDERAHVLGPSPDGGVYLIGARGGVEGLLAGVRWSTRVVLADLLANAPGAALLEPLADVDRPCDLRRLRVSRRHDAELLLTLGSARAPSARGAPDAGRVRPASVAATFHPRRGPPLLAA